MSKKVKTFAIIILIIAAIVLVVNVAGNRAPSSQSPISSSNKAAGIPLETAPVPTNDFSSSLSTIRGISIDTSIFSNPAYLALRDYPLALGTDVVGRTNPFAPVGSDAATPTSTTKVQFETLQPGKVTATTAQFGAQGIVSGTAAQVVFEYGTSDLFGSATPPVLLGKSGTALYSATGLTPATTYYVRAVLAQGSNTTVGNTMTFTTNGQ